MASKNQELDPKGEKLREECEKNNKQHFIINEGPNMCDLISLFASSDASGSRPKKCPTFPFEMGEFKAGHFDGFYVDLFCITGLMDIANIYENSELKVILASKQSDSVTLTGYYNFSTQHGILVLE